MNPILPSAHDNLSFPDVLFQAFCSVNQSEQGTKKQAMEFDVRI